MIQVMIRTGFEIKHPYFMRLFRPAPLKKVTKELELVSAEGNWRHQLGDGNAYVLEATSRLQKHLKGKNLFPPKMKCAEQDFELNIAQEVISFIHHPDTGPPNQRTLAICGTGLGKTIMMLIFIRNNFDGKRKFLVGAPNAETLTNIVTEFTKFKDYLKMDSNTLSHLIFFDIRRREQIRIGV